MLALNKSHGITFVFSTHDPRVVTYARRVVTLVDGIVTKDLVKNSNEPATNESEIIDI
jgi:putative ABC transport system ATP-binding protein